MIDRILIIGLGQLGSRYLQGLINGNPGFSVDILEPNAESYEKGIGVIAAHTESNALDVKRISMLELSARYAVCIVATSSGPRSEIIRSVSSSTQIDNWVIEKVLAQSEEQLQTILDSVGISDAAWVNTPRRRTSVYRSLKSLLNSSDPIRFDANFPNLGLGCNSIHFIDVVSWLVDSPVTSVEIISLQGWKPSKRDGYQEFDGELTAHYEDGSVLSLKSDMQGSISIDIYQDEKLFRVDESRGISEGDSFYPGRVEYQSELSYGLISDIIGRKMNDGLPNIKQSVDQHIALFKAIRSCEALQINLDSGFPIT